MSFQSILMMLPNADERARVWMNCGISQLRESSDSSFYQYLYGAESGEIDESDLHQVGLDVSRSSNQIIFDIRPALQDEDGQLHVFFQEQLTRILKAFCIRDNVIGYCQGMNFLAAALLAIFENEEDAFWGLCFLVERIYASDFFAKRPRLHGFQIDSEVFFDLTLVHLPLLCEFISHTDLHNLVKLLSFRWFIPLWIDEFPTNICLLVWDCLMLDYLTVLNPASPRSYNETLPFRQSPSPTRQLREGFLINLRFGLAVLKLAEDSIRLLVEEQDPLIVPSQAYAICLNTARTCSWEDLSRTASEFDLNGVSMSVLRESVLQKSDFRCQQVIELVGLTHFSEEELHRFQAEFSQLTENSTSLSGIKSGVDRTTFKQVISRVSPRWPEECASRLFDTMDVDSSGSVDFMELCVGLSTLCKGTTEEKLRLCFDLFDEDKSGYLDHQEIFTMSQALYKILIKSGASKTVQPSTPPPSPRSGSLDSKSAFHTYHSPRRKHMQSHSNDLNRRALGYKRVTYDDSMMESIKNSLQPDALIRRSTMSNMNSQAIEDGELADAFVSKLLKMDLNRDGKLSFQEWSQGALTEPQILKCFQIELVETSQGDFDSVQDASIHSNVSKPIPSDALKIRFDKDKELSLLYGEQIFEKPSNLNSDSNVLEPLLKKGITPESEQSICQKVTCPLCALQ